MWQSLVASTLSVSVAALATSCGDSSRSSTPSGPDAGASAITPPSSAGAPHVASTDGLAQVPTFVWADPALKGFAASQGLTTADAAARAQLHSYASLYRMKASDVASLDLRDLHDTGRGAILARFARKVDGVEVFNEVISVAMDRRLDAVALTGFVTGDVPATHKLRRGFTVSAARATTLALGHALGPAAATARVSAPRAADGGYQLIATSVTTEPVRTKKVWFRAADRSLVDAYYLEADLGDDANGNPRFYSYVISASDGAVLFKNDLTAYDHPVTYRVWADATSGALPVPFDGPQGNEATPLPGASTNNYTVPFIAQSTLTLSSLAGVGDPWLPIGATETLGNNVDAYADIALPDGFTPGSDYRADMTAPDTFDRVFDTAADPTSTEIQRKASITQLFYNINFWHDWYYVAGFDEASGNAQAVNFGRGGVQGDPIRGEAQDASGKNNANMSTPADGNRPRMQMFLWDNNQAQLSITTPNAATFTSVGTSSGWGATNFDVPGTTTMVRPVPADACAALTGTYTGQIVVADRGTCGFSQKAAFAEAAGAAGIVIANVATSANPSVASNMSLSVGQTPPTIPALSVNLADGDVLRNALAAGAVTGGMKRKTELRDGDLDNQVMAHEWGHYISNRLVFNSNGLGTTMARGLGEGWADFHAMLMTVREGDDAEPTNATWNGVYALTGYAGVGSARGNPYYFGIRRYPYSTDMTKNPLTFKHIGDGNALPVGPPVNANSSPNAEVHNSGEVWANMLWECYAALLRDTQGGSPRLSFDQARDRMRDYLVAAYKATPANPTLLEARDALLAVVLAADPVDYTLFTQAFAKRGAGVYAVAPDRASATNTPVVESFSVGAALTATSAVVTDAGSPVCNADGVLDNGETGTLTVTFRNVGNAAVAPTSVTVASTTTGISFPSGDTIAVPATAQFETVTASIPIAAAGLAAGPVTYDVTITIPDLGGGAPAPVSFTVLGNYDVVSNVSFTDTVEPPTTRWTVSNTPATLGAIEMWQRATASPTDHRWNAPSATRAATSDLVSPTMYVTSSPFVLSFRHRYSFEQPVFDGGVIEISTDGGATFTDVGATAAGYNGTLGTTSQNPIGGRQAYVNQSTGYPAFATKAIDFGSTYLGKSVIVRFRVGADAGTSSVGWDIDDIQVSGVSSPPFAALAPQPAACNNAPVANAGLSRSIGEMTPSPAFGPQLVTLDGSASFDADGSVLTYTWQQLTGPTVTLSDATARIPTFTAPLVARAASPVALVFQLTVSDGTSASAPALVQINVTNVNRPPVANAGPAQDVNERATVTLTGSASADADADDTLTYAWTQTAGPTVTLTGANTVSPTFTAPEVTAATPLTFRLVVNDGLASSPASTVTINVADLNQAPAASAGAGQIVPELTPTFDPVTVTLDATASVDPEGSALAYAWSQTGGPAVTLSDAAVAQPTFTAPLVPRAGTTVLTFQVAVSDASLASATATTTVTVTNVNRPPVANAGTPQTVDERTVATLNGSASADPDTDDTLTYAWTQTAGPSVTLASAAGPQPSFTAPEVTADTDVTFELVVHDGLTASTASTVTVTLRNVNLAPAANAGPPQSVPERSLVTLAGSATDPESDTPLTYAWTAPAGITLSSTTVANPTFTAPDVTAETPYTFTLVVSDPSSAASTPSTVTITVTNLNRVPLADAGLAMIVDAGEAVQLDGGASSDPDGGTLTYQWTQSDGPSVTLDSATARDPSFTAPAVTQPTSLTFELVVTSPSGTSAPDTVSVFVMPEAEPPPPDGGGCCSTSGGELTAGQLIVTLVPLALVLRRRRRRR